MKNRDKYITKCNEHDLMMKIEQKTGLCPIRVVAGISREEKIMRCYKYVRESCSECVAAWLNEEGKQMKLDGKWYTETEADAYVKELKGMLNESRKLIKSALFVNFKDRNAADELYDKISKVVGKE